jgi:gamma-glutamylcyclotransferase (GGCT)/AIG2-like uncharacterized protein YtfP
MPTDAFLFVYGSLRRNDRGELHPLLQGYAEFLSTASIPGILYEIENYPGAVSLPDTNGQPRVHGELYRLLKTDILFARLDHYEECTPDFAEPHEYRRSLLAVTLPDGRKQTAWLYLYNRSVYGLAAITDGHYFQQS